MRPCTVTWCSCIASSSADCVFGGVRLISSARTMFENTGPGTKTRLRFPVSGFSWMMSVPVMSEGIRSGVNWMRRKSRSSTCERVWTIRVLARPGTPVMMLLPPTKRLMRTSSTARSWPTMTLRISAVRASAASASRSARTASETSPSGAGATAPGGASAAASGADGESVGESMRESVGGSVTSSLSDSAEGRSAGGRVNGSSRRPHS